MGVSQHGFNKEGWLYVIGSNTFGLQSSHKRYYILHENCLKSYKLKPASNNEEPVRSAILSSCLRVTDNGRESINKKVLFTFTLYSSSNPSDQLKLGASSPEEAARWIHSLKDAALKEDQAPEKIFSPVNKKIWRRLGVSRKGHRRSSGDCTSSPLNRSEGMASDVIAPSPWKIFGCQNGLRLFKEAKDWDSRGRHWDNHPAIMAIGVVDGTSEAVFRTIMSLSTSRTDLVEHIDGHTDIIHKQLYSDWLPWGMKRRDLLLRRYWRREDDGTYVILFHSVIHNKCPAKKGYVRANLKSGGYVISPVNQGKQSLVKHMLAIDWKYWKLYLRPSSARSITIRMLERVAALRELFKAKMENHSSDYTSGEFPILRDIRTPPVEIDEIKREDVQIPYSGEITLTREDDMLSLADLERPASGRTSLFGLNDTADEFFDVPETTDTETSDYLNSDAEWSAELSHEIESPTTQHPKCSPAAGLVKRLHELAVQKKGYMDLQEASKVDSIPAIYGSTLQEDPTHNLPCSWAAGDPSSFLIRGENYLKDNRKVKAKSTTMQMIGADWLKSGKREDNIGGRFGSIIQQYAANGGPEFFFVVNIQIPAGTTMYTLALYYMTKTPLENTPLLHRFVNGDDAFRNSRFKLIPYISKGSWIVKQSVGKKACLIGHALDVHYFRGKNYLEIEIDVSSSTVARGVVNLVLGYLNNLVIEMAFLIQGNAQDELPECLLGVTRLNNLDAEKSIPRENMSEE
ncbi:hypothetical protein ACFE04_000392 [Oxalis oulophora]